MQEVDHHKFGWRNRTPSQQLAEDNKAKASPPPSTSVLTEAEREAAHRDMMLESHSSGYFRAVGAHPPPPLRSLAHIPTHLSRVLADSIADGPSQPVREECTVWVGGIPDGHPRL